MYNIFNQIPLLSSATLPFFSRDPTATIDIGVVQGVATNLPCASHPVHKYLGIPFAQSPPERFSPPTPPAPLKSTLPAKEWKPACVQRFAYPEKLHDYAKSVFDPFDPPESEDCLYLNIYAPSSPPPKEGRAVMFWIFGGGIEFGTASQQLYDGSAFAAYQDVIVVAPNYRVNVFGFPQSPQIPLNESQLGFLDQSAALEWVQRNIHAFGGDKNKVTLFGESAGALSIDVLLTTPAYAAKPPFRAAILQSSGLSYRPLPHSGEVKPWDTLAAALECNDAATQLDCVRAVPADKIKHIVEHERLTFNPFRNPSHNPQPGAARASGVFARVPVLTGTTANEGRVYSVAFPDMDTFLKKAFGLSAPQQIPAIRAAYPIGSTQKSEQEAMSQIFTDFAFTCGLALWTNATASHGVPTWRYYYNASFPNGDAFPGAGAWHSAEIPTVFQTYPGGPVCDVTDEPTGRLPTHVPPTQAQRELSSFMNTAWANFAKNPTAGPQWADAQGSEGRLAVLGVSDDDALAGNGSAQVRMIRPGDIDANCHLFFPAYRAINGDLPGLS